MRRYLKESLFLTLNEAMYRRVQHMLLMGRIFRLRMLKAAGTFALIEPTPSVVRAITDDTGRDIHRMHPVLPLVYTKINKICVWAKKCDAPRSIYHVDALEASGIPGDITILLILCLSSQKASRVRNVEPCSVSTGNLQIVDVEAQVRSLSLHINVRISRSTPPTYMGVATRT